MKKVFIKRAVAVMTALTFVFANVVPSYAQAVVSRLDLPVPGSMVQVSSPFTPAIVRGIRVYTEQPLKFDFIVDSGDTGLKGAEFKKESEKLIRYFLASLTLPENDLWVNLSPYERDRIVPDALGSTEMGRDMLAQDYLLKQIAASLTNPESEQGKEFWSRVYAKAYEQYGTTDIPVDTFNKVWIMPAKVEVYVQNDKAFIVESKLKVMLEEDYLALQKNADPALGKRAEGNSQERAFTAQVVRDVFIPVLEKDVNEGKNFAQLRQIYQSIILAYWYKTTLKQSIINKVYSDQQKVKGIDLSNKETTETIYAQYVDTFRKGVYNIIKEEYDQYTQELIPRKYFSGGVNITHLEVGDNVIFTENIDSLAQYVESKTESLVLWEAKDSAFIDAPKGHTGNHVDQQFVKAQEIFKRAVGNGSISNVELEDMQKLVEEAIRLLKEVDIETLDDSGFPMADGISAAALAVSVLTKLNNFRKLSDQGKELLDLLKKNVYGLELKQALGYVEGDQFREVSASALKGPLGYEERTVDYYLGLIREAEKARERAFRNGLKVPQFDQELFDTIKGYIIKNKELVRRHPEEGRINAENLNEFIEVIQKLVKQNFGILGIAKDILRYLEMVRDIKEKYRIEITGYIAPGKIEMYMKALEWFPLELSNRIRIPVELTFEEMASTVGGKAGLATEGRVELNSIKGFSDADLRHSLWHELMHKFSLSSDIEGRPLLPMSVMKRIAKAAGFLGAFIGPRFVLIDDLTDDYKQFRRIGYGNWVYEEEDGTLSCYVDKMPDFNIHGKKYVREDGRVIHVKPWRSEPGSYWKTTPFEAIAEAGAFYISNSARVDLPEKLAKVVGALRDTLFVVLSQDGFYRRYVFDPSTNNAKKVFIADSEMKRLEVDYKDYYNKVDKAAIVTKEDKKTIIPEGASWSEINYMLQNKLISGLGVEDALSLVEEAKAWIIKFKDTLSPEEKSRCDLALGRMASLEPGIRADVALKRIAQKHGRTFFDTTGWLAENYSSVKEAYGHVTTSEGLYKMIFENGGKLTGSQQQRIFLNPDGEGQIARVRLVHGFGGINLIFGKKEFETNGVVIDKTAGEATVTQDISLGLLTIESKKAVWDIILNYFELNSEVLSEAKKAMLASALGYASYADLEGNLLNISTGLEQGQMNPGLKDDKNLGGIDFNARSMNIETKGKAIDFSLPSNMSVESMRNIEGFVPVIINIVPVTDFKRLLGLSNDVVAEASS